MDESSDLAARATAWLERHFDPDAQLLRYPSRRGLPSNQRDLQHPVAVDLYLGVPDEAACQPASPVEVVRTFTPTHWGARVMTVRDPDGRPFRLEAGSDTYPDRRRAGYPDRTRRVRPRADLELFRDLERGFVMARATSPGQWTRRAQRRWARAAPSARAPI